MRSHKCPSAPGMEAGSGARSPMRVGDIATSRFRPVCGFGVCWAERGRPAASLAARMRAADRWLPLVWVWVSAEACSGLGSGLVLSAMGGVLRRQPESVEPRCSRQGMDRFVSTFTNRIDAKSRVSIPAPSEPCSSATATRARPASASIATPRSTLRRSMRVVKDLQKKSMGFSVACRIIRTSGTSSLSRSMVKRNS